MNQTDGGRATGLQVLAIIEDHHPEIGADIDDSTWLECSCGWDSSKPKAVDWHQHLVDAVAGSIDLAEPQPLDPAQSRIRLHDEDGTDVTDHYRFVR